MWSHRDPSIRKSGIGNVFIKNLHKSIDNKALYDTFSAFGNILSCKVATDETNQSKGYGFVHYETQEAADQAIAKVNGMLLNDKKVYVGPFIRRAERDFATDGDKKFTNVFIKDLDESITEQHLTDAFSAHGKVANAVIMRDGNGKSKGFGFVNFEDPESAKIAVEMMNGSKMGPKNIWVGRAQKKSERQAELRNKFEQMKMERMNKYQGVNLYIKNLDDTIDDEKLRQEFSQFGSITSAVVMRDEKTGRSKGVGFVCFTTTEEATKAITEMNGRMFGTKPLYVALAQRRAFRRAQLEAQHMGRGAPQMRQPGIAAAIPAPHIYPQHVFYPQPGAPIPQAQRPGFVYPQQMVPRRWGPNQQPVDPNLQYAMPNYPMPMGQRGGRGGRRVPGAQPGAPGAKEVPRGGVPQNPAARNNFKYTRNVRNPRAPEQQMQVPQMMQQPLQAMPALMNGQEPLSVTALAQASTDEQNQIIGQRLYPLIHSIDPVNAPKITGMLLEMERGELLHLLESPEALRERVDEAISVLQQTQQESQGGENDEVKAE